MSKVMIMGMLVKMMIMRMMLKKMMMIVIAEMIMQTDLIVAERRMTVRVRQVMHRAQRQDTYLVASYASWQHQDQHNMNHFINGIGGLIRLLKIRLERARAQVGERATYFLYSSSLPSVTNPGGGFLELLPCL